VVSDPLTILFYLDGVSETFSAPPAPILDGILARIRYRPSAQSAIEARIAAAILEDPERVARESIVAFSRRTSVSTGSVVRFAKLVGLEGYQDLRLALAAAGREGFNGTTAPRKPGSRFGDYMDEQVRATMYASQEIAPEAVERAASLIAHAHRVDIVAVGASAAIGHSLLFALTLLGLHVRYLPDSAEQAASAAFLGPGDVLIAVSFSGQTRTVVDAAARAAESEATVVALACNQRSPLVTSATVPLVVDASKGRFTAEWPLRTALMAVSRALVLSVADYIPPGDLQRRRATWTSGRFGMRYEGRGV
jgi:DNA-binding MurR/RpiR family transcriptional regulator